MVIASAQLGARPERKDGGHAHGTLVTLVSYSQPRWRGVTYAWRLLPVCTVAGEP